MNKVIRALGSFLLTCIAFACPIGVTALFALGKAADVGLITMLLLAGTVGEFLFMVTYLYCTFDEDT